MNKNYIRNSSGQGARAITIFPTDGDFAHANKSVNRISGRSGVNPEPTVKSG